MLQKFRHISTALLFAAFAGGCSSPEQDVATLRSADATTVNASSELALNAYWLYEKNGAILQDPQTSGLVAWRNGTLMSIADGSAHASQVLKLLQIDPLERKIVKKIPFVMSDSVAQSCFAEFLSERPDLEALVVDPDDDTLFYSVTEDASDYQLSQECQQRFKNTGSTEFPTLLMRIALNADENSAIVTHVRALQYEADMQVGNFPNDGIEGMTFGGDRSLYLALERDQNYQARVFSVTLNEAFWQTEDFAPVTDVSLQVPVFNDKQPHPINALAFASYNGSDWLLGAARNDNQLWIMDTSGEQKTQVVSVSFFAQIAGAETSECPAFEAMNNYSMEGMAVADDTLWIVNDPWKNNYMKNLQCPSNKGNFEKMAPLLTSIKLDKLFHSLD